MTGIYDVLINIGKTKHSSSIRIVVCVQIRWLGKYERYYSKDA